MFQKSLRTVKTAIALLAIAAAGAIALLAKEGEAGRNSPGESVVSAPTEFSLNALGASYMCRKVPCQNGSPTCGVPSPSPTPAFAKALCDADFVLVARYDGKTYKRETFISKERCNQALEQFRRSNGCYCSPDYVPTCVHLGGAEVRFEAVASAFSSSERCIAALDQLERDVELKSR